MAVLLHEVWGDFGDNGESLPMLVLAGPRCDEARQRFLSPKTRLLTTFRAGSHFEAMTIYYRLMDWGKYTTDQPWDYETYPEEWLREQRAALNPPDPSG